MFLIGAPAEKEECPECVLDMMSSYVFKMSNSPIFHSYFHVFFHMSAMKTTTPPVLPERSYSCGEERLLAQLVSRVENFRSEGLVLHARRADPADQTEQSWQLFGIFSYPFVMSYHGI